MKKPKAFWLDLGVKVTLILLLAFGAFSGLERFAGKAFGWRLIGYSVAALLVPAIWAARGRRSPYPYAADTLFVLPFLIDTIGNALNLYDTIDWWDDANHFVNWALLSGAVATVLLRTHVAGSGALRPRRRVRGGHCDPVGDRRVLRVHPQLIRVGDGVHRHARRPLARSQRLDVHSRDRCIRPDPDSPAAQRVVRRVACGNGARMASAPVCVVAADA